MRGYQYRAREGRFYLEAWDAVARLSGEAGQTIVLPAQSLFHIEQMHVGDQATSRFAGVVSVTTLLREVAQRLPVEIVFEHSEARFEFELARLVGTDAVASHQDMLERGQLTRDELARLEPLRARVERLNLFGSEAERKAFREAANGELAGTRIEFFMRRGALVQQYRGRPASTRWVAIAIHRGGRGPGAPAEIRTLYPGRVRPPLPAGHWYFRHYGADRPSRGLAILEKLARDETLSKRYELAAVAGQRRAQDFWWRHGFVAPG